MTIWNYVVTAQKPTVVTHSCVGKFTARDDLNIVIAKCTRIEIHKVTPQGLQDLPVYGKVAALELFCPHGMTQDLLFLATERSNFCVLQWDSDAGEIITRAMGDVVDWIEHRKSSRKIGIIDPQCESIGLHLFRRSFEVIPFDNKSQLKVAVTIRLEELPVLDIQYLYGCPKPTIAVLYQGKKDVRHIKTYEVSLKDKDFTEGPWSRSDLNNGADWLIPVPLPLCGVLIIGVETIQYCSALAFNAISVKPAIVTAYGKVDADGSRYLLGDRNGLLHLLVITHNNGRVTGLKIELLGETSIASSISYLANDVVFVGSFYGDSQLVKINLHPDANVSSIEVLERYPSLGHIMDFCVVDDLEMRGQGQVVTCSGVYKDGSVRIVWNGIGINELAFVELKVIQGMWSLKSATNDPHDTFLVVSFMTETCVLEMNTEDVLKETEFVGFSSELETLFCHDAVYDQLVQVTSSSVRLVSSTSRELRHEWFAPSGYSINVATANASQVLVAAGVSHLFYLEIGDGTLGELMDAKLEYAISCLDINPVGDNPTYSHIAAVGMWTDTSVQIYSLPNLSLITKELIEGNMTPRSVLLCCLEGISYLLCALGDGHLLNFVLNVSTGGLADRKKVSLGTQPITLRAVSSKNVTRVFAASDRPTVIYSSNKKLLYSNAILKGVSHNSGAFPDSYVKLEVSHICSFNHAAFPDSLAIAKEGRLSIGTLDDIQKLHIRSIPLGEHACHICHQEQTHTFALCTLRYNQSSAEDYEMHSIRILDDRTFELLAIYPLDQYECGRLIVSCSFTDDDDVYYYCVGTGYVVPEVPEEKETTQGPWARILVFMVEDGELQLVAEKEAESALSSLNAFNGKLLAAIGLKFQLFKLMLRDDGTRELQSEYDFSAYQIVPDLETRGDFIVSTDFMHRMSLFIYKDEEGAINQRASCYIRSRSSAFIVLDNDTYLGGTTNGNLFTVRENSVDEDRLLEVVDEYHLGDIVNRFRHGSLVMQLPDSDVGQIPTVIFGTQSGVIGVIASIPHEQYVFLEELQANLRKVIKGIGGLCHEQWRTLYKEEENRHSESFLDGDLIELFLGLPRNRREEISKSMGVPVEEIMKRVEEMRRLH